MVKATNGEFDHIKQLVCSQSPFTTADVRTIVEAYFKTVEWSILKQEWELMSIVQKEALYSKLLVEAVSTNTATMKTFKLDDIDEDDFDED